MAPSRTGVVADSWPTSRRLIKPLVLALVVALSSMADGRCYSSSPPNSSYKAHFPACAQFHAAAPFHGGATAPPGLDAQWSYLATAATRLRLRAAFRAANLRAAPSGTAAPSSSNHHSFAAAGCFAPTMLQAVLQYPLVNLFERFRSGASHHWRHVRVEKTQWNQALLGAIRRCVVWCHRMAVLYPSATWYASGVPLSAAIVWLVTAVLAVASRRLDRRRARVAGSPAQWFHAVADALGGSTLGSRFRALATAHEAAALGLARRPTPVTAWRRRRRTYRGPSTHPFDSLHP